MPASMMSPAVGPSLMVSGSTSAMAPAGPSPGSTPTIVPRTTPGEAGEEVGRRERDEQLAHGSGTPSQDPKISRLATVTPSASATGRHQPPSPISRAATSTSANDVRGSPAGAGRRRTARARRIMISGARAIRDAGRAPAPRAGRRPPARSCQRASAEQREPGGQREDAGARAWRACRADSGGPRAGRPARARPGRRRSTGRGGSARVIARRYCFLSPICSISAAMSRSSAP